VDQKNQIESMIQTEKENWFLWLESKTKPNQLKTNVVWLIDSVLGFSF
jgi:hypothetical protein